MNQKGGRQATRNRWADKLEAILRDEADGLNFEQIVARFERGAWTVRKAIACSAARGGILSLRMPNQLTVWWHADNAASLHARSAQIRRERQQRNTAAQRAKYVSHPNTASESEWPIVQRIVPAHLARPLRPTCPNSVWALAA